LQRPRGFDVEGREDESAADAEAMTVIRIRGAQTPGTVKIAYWQ
jgi:hypothetical protein